MSSTTPVSLAQFVEQEIKSSLEVKQRLFSDRALLAKVVTVSEVLVKAYQAGRKTLFAGNGGSAADAQHLAAEFVSRFYFDRPGLPALSLSSDPSTVTAIGNDYGYDQLFARQVQAHGVPGDVFIGISTSGQSPNVLKAIAEAKARGLITVALTSVKGREMGELCDHAILVDSTVTPKIQECHITIGHAICAAVEQALFKR